MPTFTFEKISAAKSAVPPTMAVMSPPGGRSKPRGVIVQLLDKLAEGKLRRNADKSRESFTESDIKPRR